MMTETLASVADSAKVELVNEKMQKIIGSVPMTPDAAAFLARSLLACAAHLVFDKSIKAGTLCADAHLPVLKWTLSVGTESRRPVVIFSVPPGIDLTFQLSPQVERELGAALIAHAEGAPPPELPPGMVH